MAAAVAVAVVGGGVSSVVEGAGAAVLYRALPALIRNPIFNSRGFNASALFLFTNTLLEIIEKRGAIVTVSSQNAHLTRSIAEQIPTAGALTAARSP